MMEGSEKLPNSVRRAYHGFRVSDGFEKFKEDTREFKTRYGDGVLF